METKEIKITPPEEIWIDMTQEQKAKAYDEALSRAKEVIDNQNASTIWKDWLKNTFPELKESEDEKIRKAIIRILKGEIGYISKEDTNKYIAWLEKQGKEISWKPSKEEMDVLYGLAYITNQYDEHKEEVITRLYQDLKREFFNGSSYENMFTTNTSAEDDVRRRSTIQVLEYARSLDTYNQYGKANIDKNIAWLEKQNSPILSNSSNIGKSEECSADKIEPKKLDADKVIEWLDENVSDFWGSPCNPQNVIEKFKEDFGL